MFLNFWALVIGALAVGLPVVIHLLTRPRPIRIPLSTLRFVQEAVHQRRARHRLRDFLILALRTLAVLLIALAIARPLIGEKAMATADESSDTIRVVIVDSSQSMAAQTRGIAAFERARSAASSQLAYRAGVNANLILAGTRPAAVFSRPSTNFSALRQALADAAPRAEQINVQAALNLAADMLAASSTSEGVRRELIVVSDFQRTNWATADFSTLPVGTTIQLESVAPESSTANFAILRAGTRSRAELGRPIPLEVDVANYSPANARVRVEVALGETVYPMEGDCPPYSKTTLTGDIMLRTRGWHIGRAKLVGVDDALPADDERPCVVEVKPSPVYALVTRQSPQEKPSSSYYLERALMPAENTRNAERAQVIRIDPDNPDHETTATADVIVIDHPGRLSEETANLFASLVRRGRGMLYVAAQPMDAENLRRLNAAEGGAGAMPVEFAPPPVAYRRSDLFLAEVREKDLPFSIFGDELTSIVSELRFAGGLVSRQVPGALAENVLASFSDRSAFLVSAPLGAGTLIVLNADLGTSNLPRSPAFVPMVGELMRRLTSGGQTTNEVTSGEPIAVSLPAEITGVEDLVLEGPDTDQPGRNVMRQEASAILWVNEGAGPPGVYTVKRGDTVAFALPSTLPTAEADLRTMPAEIFKERLTGGRTVSSHSASDRTEAEQDHKWSWLATICLLCLIGEVAVARAFRT